MAVEQGEELDLRDYLRIIRSRRWMIILAVVVTTVVAVVVSTMQTPMYESEARVLITERDPGQSIAGVEGGEFSSQPERNLQIQVELMRGHPMLQATIDALELDMTPEELEEKIDVSAVGQTSIVSIKVTDEDPERAALIANTLAESYVTWSRDYYRGSIRSAISQVEKRLEEASKKVEEISERIEDEGEDAKLLSELDIAKANYTALAEQLENLKVSEQLETGSGHIVGQALPADEPSSPKPLRNGALGAVVGLVFGLGMAFLSEYLDTTLRSTEDVQAVYEVPVLGTIPLEDRKRGEKRRLSIITDPGSASAEAYRGLRNSLDFINFERDIKVLMVCSAEPAEGKSTVASNLAASLAQAGKKVVLINADFRRPTLDQFFDVSNMIGLSDVLSGAFPLGVALQVVDDVPGLRVLNAGKMPPNPSEMLGSTRMKEVIEQLSAESDWVIVDSPPVLAVADATSVARWADAVLMVAKVKESTRDAAHAAKEALGNVGARFVGVVVWGFTSDGYARAGYRAYGAYAGYHPVVVEESSRPDVRASRRSAPKGRASKAPGPRARRRA